VDAKIRNSFEAISNLIYLIRAKTPDPIATLIYLDMVEAQVESLYKYLDAPRLDS